MVRTSIGHWPIPEIDWPVAGASALAGLAIGLQFRGLRTVLAAEIDPLPATATMAAVIGLLAGAAGLLLPENVLALIERLIRRTPRPTIHSEPRHSNPPPGRSTTSHDDSSLPWLSLALIAAAAGVLAAVTVSGSGPIFRTYRNILEQFFWNNISLAALEWSLVAGLLIAPCAMAGILVIALTVTGESRGRRSSPLAIQGGVLLGFMLALWLGTGSAWTLSAEREVIVGTLPLFALAAGAVLMSQREERTSRREPKVDCPPETSFGAHVLLRAAPLVASFAAATAGTGWLGCQPVQQVSADRMLGLMLAGIIVGGFVRAVLWTRTKQDLPAGPVVWACGVGAGSSAVFCTWAGESMPAQAIGVGLLSLPLGYALQATTHAWMARSTSRSIGFAHLSVLILVGTALGMVASRWWGLPRLGAMGTLAAGSLLLLAWGGLLELYAEGRPAHATRLHLALVFASLAAAIILFPAVTRTWTRRDLARAAAAEAGSVATSTLFEALAQVRTACLIGVSPGCLEKFGDDHRASIDLLPLGSWRAGTASLHDRLNVVSMPASRALRLSHTRYQLVYHSVHPTHDPALQASLEWLSQLNQHVVAGGTLILDLPLACLSSSDIVDLTATLTHVTGQPCEWRVERQAAPRVILRSRPGLAVTAHGHNAGWQPAEMLAAVVDHVPRIRSLRNSAGGRGDSTPQAAAAIEQIMSGSSVAVPVARGARPGPSPQ